MRAVVIFLLLLAFVADPAVAKRDADDADSGHGKSLHRAPASLKKLHHAAMDTPIRDPVNVKHHDDAEPRHGKRHVEFSGPSDEAGSAHEAPPASLPEPAPPTSTASDPPQAPAQEPARPGPVHVVPLSGPELAPAAAEPGRGAPAPAAGGESPEPAPAQSEAADGPEGRAHVVIPVSGAVTGAGSGIALGAALGVTAVGLGVRAIHHHRSPPAPGVRGGPTPPSTRSGLAELLRRAERNPFDGEARFRLGLELLERGRDKEALRYLAQAFRYHPQSILEVLREPRLAHVRDHAGVRQILRRFQREASRRLWTGYT